MRSIFFGPWLVLERMGAAHSRRWPSGVARDWYSEPGRLVGSNYIPATAINQLEM
jgi:hypothetical protein